MRLSLTITLLFFLLGLNAQQAWDLFPKGQQTWFAAQDSVVEYYNDSTIVEGNQRTHLFGAEYLFKILGNCTEEILLELWQDEGLDYALKIDTLYSNENGFYSLVGVDTLPFYQNAEVGHSWWLPTAQQDSFLITCTANELENFLDLQDSIKTFTLQFFENGNAIAHPLNAAIFRLSKNYGFVEYVPFYSLHTATTDYRQHEIIGLVREARHGYTAFTEDFLPYTEGDILKWKTTKTNSNVPDALLTETWFVDTIQGINLLDIGLLQLEVKRSSYREKKMNDVLIETSSETNVDALFSISKVLIDTLLNTPIQHPVSFFDYFLYLRPNPTMDTLDITEYGNFVMRKNYSLEDCSTMPVNGDKVSFKINNKVGMLQTVVDKDTTGIEILELLGYQSAEWTWGDLEELPFVNSLVEDIPTLFDIYPNPTQDYIYFTNFEMSNQAFAFIYDTKGQLFQKMKVENNTTISVQNLPAGLYYIEIEDKDKTQRAKFVKQ